VNRKEPDLLTRGTVGTVSTAGRTEVLADDLQVVGLLHHSAQNYHTYHPPYPTQNVHQGLVLYYNVFKVQQVRTILTDALQIGHSSMNIA
jgi:hypothetical protein